MNLPKLFLFILFPIFMIFMVQYINTTIWGWVMAMYIFFCIWYYKKSKQKKQDELKDFIDKSQKPGQLKDLNPIENFLSENNLLFYYRIDDIPVAVDEDFKNAFAFDVFPPRKITTKEIINGGLDIKKDEFIEKVEAIK